MQAWQKNERGEMLLADYGKINQPKSNKFNFRWHILERFDTIAVWEKGWFQNSIG